MDKTCIIILLLVIIVIAVFYKEDKSEHPKNLDQYYKNITQGASGVINDISSGAGDVIDDISSGTQDAYNQIKKNKYYQDITHGFDNALNSIDKRFNNQQKESFNTNNNFLARRLMKKANLNNLPNGKGDYPIELVHTNPILVQIKADKGEHFITVTDVNGINPGDMILINPRGKNSEINYVVGIGNNVLKLNKPLENYHRPNEEIFNRYNENTNPTSSRFQNVGYADINQENREVEFTPNDNTWAFNVNVNEHASQGWCGPDSQFIKNSKFPKCVVECKKNPRCNAVRWINDTNDCSLMKSCDSTNNDKKWRHMYFNTPTFSLGNPKCSSEKKPLDKNTCKQVANAQNMPFYNWSENNQWPEGCFQYQVGGKPAVAHNPSNSTNWPNTGYDAIQYCNNGSIGNEQEKSEATAEGSWGL